MHLSLQLVGPTIAVGAVVSIPLLAALVALVWRYSRRSKRADKE